MRPENITHAYISAFVDELARSGVRHACICPGSRSTPLAMLLDAHPDIRVWMHLDERSASFFALGMAKAGREVVAVLSTSGTAAANFLPAVVEARYARIPLLVLTADRPPELQDVGANQTIDQVHLFGRHAKWFVDVSLPEATAEAYIRTLACRSVGTALAQPSGPVHLNFPFREPLVPLPMPNPAPLAREDLSKESPGKSTPLHIDRKRPAPERPYVTLTDAPRSLDSSLVERLAADLFSTERGLIICGPPDHAELPDALSSLANRLGYPILADPLSQVRCGPHDRSLVLDAYDAFLRDDHCADSLAPEVILRFGAMPTSKPVSQYLQRHRRCRQMVVDGGAGWNDPTLLARDIIHTDPRRLCEALSMVLERDGMNAMGEPPLTPGPANVSGQESLDTPMEPLPGNVSPTLGEGRMARTSCPKLPLSRARERGPGGEGEWPSLWLRANDLARQAIQNHLASIHEPFEGKVFAELANLLPDGAVLFAGNSMPVRDLDTFFPASERRIRFLANRGASGIDGVASTALGAHAATTAPLVLVIGDLSFYHDLNGLLGAKLHRLDATVVLLNNDGGGIFSFLPQAAHPEQFETLFGTPHGLDFRPVVEMYGGHFERVTTWDAFRDALASWEDRGLRVIEVPTDRRRNVELHRELWAAVSAALAHEGVGASCARPGASCVRPAG